MCEVEGYYRLCYQRIPHLQGCLGGEVLHCCRDVHNHHDSMAVPFRVRQPSRNVHSFEVFEQIHRIEKPQVQNCDTCSELKQKCNGDCRIKILYASPQ